MTDVPTTSLPPGQTALLDALNGVVISDGARASLAWLAGFEAHTVASIAIVITETVGDSDITPVPRSDRFSTE